MRPPTRCPVCGDAAIAPVKHPEAFKVPANQTVAYRCSKNHTFYALTRTVEQAHRLRGEAHSSRTAADDQIRRARVLRGETDSGRVSIIQSFEPIDTEEAVQKSREAVRRSKETRTKVQHTRAFSKELAEQVRLSVADAKRKHAQRRGRGISGENHEHTG